MIEIFDKTDEQRCIDIIVDGFAGKFHHALGDDHEKMKELLFDANFIQSYEENLVYTYKEEGKVAGIIILATREHPFKLDTRIPSMKMYKKYGRKTIKGLIDIASIMEHKCAYDELYVEMLGVAKDFRGKGIGSKLIDYVIDKYDGNHRITLDVIDTNPRAKALYERKGFEVILKKEHKKFKKHCGFDYEELMEYKG